MFGDIKVSKHFPWVPYYKPEGYKVRGEQVRKLLTLIEPGDVLVRGFDDYLDGYFIGHWSHVGLVLDSESVIHALAEGVIIEDVINFFRTDRIIVLRPLLTVDEKKKVIEKAKTFIGREYDFGFNFTDDNALSCSELVFECFLDYHLKLGMKRKIEKFLLIGKREVVWPMDFLSFSGFDHV